MRFLRAVAVVEAGPPLDDHKRNKKQPTRNSWE